MLLSSTNAAAPIAGSTPRPALPQIGLPAATALPADASVLAQKNNNASPAPKEIEHALKTLNEFTALVAQDVSFSLDEESGKTIVKVVDTATQEVLRQFPSAEALSIARSIDKMQGLLIREKA